MMKNKAEQKGIISCPPDPAYEPDPRGLGANYFDKLKQFDNKIAQIDAETGKTQTYKELLKDSICVAQEMIARGITCEDVVCLCSYNQIYSFTPILAATYILAKVTSLDPTLSLDDMEYTLNLTKPRIIFCVSESLATIEKALTNNNFKCDVVVFGETEKHIPFKEFLIERGNENTFEPKCAKNIFDTAFIYFSSGTTGRPKGTCLHHYGLNYSTNVARSFVTSNVSLIFTSSYWLSHVLLISATFFDGGIRLVCKDFERNTILEIIEKFKVTNIFLPPAYTYDITANSEYRKYDLTSLQTFMTGGSSINAQQILSLRKIFPNSIVTQGYGLTEITGPFSIFNRNTELNWINSKPSSCGRILPGCSCKVVDLDTKEICGPNCTGELMIKSKCLMNGYYNNPEETNNSFDEDGYLHTGDLAYFDEEECFYIVGRAKEMFKYRSWHILPAELESILLAHPAIKEAVVIGVPHEVDGDRPMAVVIPHQGADITESDVINYFNEKVIDRKKLRGGVKFVKNIPKTYTGKYSRRILLDKVIKNEI